MQNIRLGGYGTYSGADFPNRPRIQTRKTRRRRRSTIVQQYKAIVEVTRCGIVIDKVRKLNHGQQIGRLLYEIRDNTTLAWNFAPQFIKCIELSK